MQTKLMLLSFISFYVGQLCYNEEELPPSLSLIEKMEGLEGILDTCIYLTDKYLTEHPDFEYDIEDGEIQTKLISFIHSEVGEVQIED